MPSGRRELAHFTFQTLSVRAYFIRMTGVKACGVRPTYATAHAYWTTNPTTYAFQSPSVWAYFFQTRSVKVCGVRTTHATAYTFRMTSARVFCLPDEECQGIFLSDDECQEISLLDAACQGISSDT